VGVILLRIFTEMKISSKLTLILLFAVLLPSLITTYMNFYHSEKIITKTVEENLNADVKQRIEYANKYAKHLVKSMTILSKSHVLTNAIKTNNMLQVNNLFKYTLNEHMLYDIFLISQSGKIIFTIKKEADLYKNLNEKPFLGGKFSQTYQKSLQTGKTTISNFSYYEPSKRYAAFIVIPIFENDKRIGTLATQLNIDKFFELANDYNGLGKTGEIILAQKSGDKAIFINKLRNDHQPIFSRFVKIGSNIGKPIQEAVQGHFGSGIYSDYKDTEVIASWGYIDSFKIGMVIKIDTDEAYFELENLKKFNMMIGIIILLVILYVIRHIKKIVNTLEETRNQYEYAINGTHDGLWDWNLVTNELYLSPRAKEMFGYKDDEMSNNLKEWESRIHKDDLEHALTFIEECHKDPNKEYNIEYRVLHKDGHYIWILDRGQTFFDKNNNPIRMVGFHTDITRRKELEYKLTSLKQQFEQFMEFMPAYIIMKENDVIVYANSRTNKLFERNTIIGETVDKLFPTEKAKKIKSLENRAYKNGFAEEVSITKTDKNEEKVYRNMAFVIDKKEKRKLGIVSINITKEYLANREISRVLSAFERSDISVIITDLQGDIQYVNPSWCKVTGYSKEELIGENPRIVKSGDIPFEVYKKMWDELTNGHVWHNELKNKRKDGTEFWEDSTIMPSFDLQGNIDGYIAFKLEISDKIKLRKELKDKEELMIAQSRQAAMGEMISMIAHQWRQPISVIAMDANNVLVDIELDNVNNNSLKEDIDDILDQTQYLSQTIDDFRNFFKPTKLQDEVLVSSVFEESFSVISKSLQNNNIEVENHFNTTTKVSIYSRELLQVLINILKNAKEALVENRPTNRKIINRIDEENKNIIITICDNAGGIDENIIDKIFDPYFTTKDEINGTGIGLYMSKTIINKHFSGTLSVYNSGSGACFKIKFPIYGARS